MSGFGEGGDGFGRLAAMLREGRQARPRQQMQQGGFMPAMQPYGGGGGMPQMAAAPSAGGGMASMASATGGFNEAMRRPEVQQYLSQLLYGNGKPEYAMSPEGTKVPIVNSITPVATQ